MQKRVKFRSLDIASEAFFTMDDNEYDELEKKENARMKELEEIIFANDFKALEYVSENGSREILHRSTRPGILFQLSYLWPGDIPVMHDNFIRTEEPLLERVAVESKDAMLRHFSDLSLQDDLVLTVLA